MTQCCPVPLLPTLDHSRRRSLSLSLPHIPLSLSREDILLHYVIHRDLRPPTIGVPNRIVISLHPDTLDILLCTLDIRRAANV